jgi:phosphohistidine phosphatase SixA
MSVIDRSIMRLWARAFLAATVASLTASALMTPARASTPALSSPDALNMLRQGGVALLLRHGQTVPGIGDPDGFRLDDCATQRNLSASGKADLQAMGQRIRQSGVAFSRVLSSQWCRCLDTAQLLVTSGVKVEPWPALNSQFSGNPVRPGANADVLAQLRQLPAGQTWLLVTHQVNIGALTGVSPESGEAVLVRPTRDGVRVLGRVKI